MEYIQALALPFLIILPTCIIYAFLLRFIRGNRIILAIISGIFGGIFYGQFFAGGMHLYNTLISTTYFGMFGAGMFYGLAELGNKKRLVNFKGVNIGFTLASLIILYLIFFDIRGIAFGLNLEFISNYWLIWILNLIFIIGFGLLVNFTLKKIKSAER